MKVLFPTISLKACSDKPGSKNPPSLAGRETKLPESVAILSVPSPVSLICDYPECNICGPKVHKYCFTTSLSQFTDLINEPLGNYQSFLKKLNSTEDDLMVRLKEGHDDIAKQHRFGCFQGKYSSLLAEVY